MLVRLTADLDCEAVAELLDRQPLLDVVVPSSRPTYAERLWHRLQFRHEGAGRFWIEVEAEGWLAPLWSLVVLGGVGVVSDEDMPDVERLPRVAIDADAGTLAELEALGE